MRARAIALAAIVATSIAHAQVVRPLPRPTLPREPPRRPAPLATSDDDASDLRARFGVERAARLVRSSDASERLRGLERAAAVGSPEAIALLVDALESTRPTHADARARIAIARGLAAHTDQANVRAALLTIVSAPAPRARAGEADDPDAGPRFEIARRIAALAMAQAKDARAIDALAALVRADAAGTAAAMAALAAFPPSGATKAWERPMTPNALRLAARVGDLRALEPAFDAARGGDLAARAAAIEALGAMGDTRVIPIAQAAVNDVLDPRLRVAAASALASLGAPEAARAVEQLLAEDATAARGIELASIVRSPGIVRALAARGATASDPAVRAAAIAAIGRDAGRESVEALVAFLHDPIVRADAADALARSPSDAARGAIEAMAAGSDAVARRLALKTYAVRALVRGERSGAIDRVARSLAASGDAADRAAAVFVRVALGDAAAATSLGDRDPQVRRAAAMASFARDDDASRAALLDRRAREDDAATRSVLGAGLAEGDPEGRVPTRALAACARSGAADAPSCALAFARRADASEASDVDALLAARDPILRAHVARGLALGADPTRAGRLAAAYAYEADPLVRRAIVAGLARDATSAPAAASTLDAAARLDPDAEVRWTAARGKTGAPLATYDAATRDVAWIHLVDAGGAPPAPGATGALIRADGLAVPIAFDADGDALVAGVPAGSARLVLAPRFDGSYSPSE